MLEPPKSVFSLSGTFVGDVVSLPPDTRVALLWANPAGIPRDYSFIAGLGTIDRVAKTYSLNLSAVPHDSAWITLPVLDTTRPVGPGTLPVLLRRDSTFKLGVGFILLLNDATLKEGVLPPTYPLQERFVGAVNNMAVIYRFGTVPALPASPRGGFTTWAGKFPLGFSLGKGARATMPGFDSFEPSSESSPPMTITSIRGFQVPNWTR